MAELVKVARVDDIPEGEMRGYEVGHTRIVIGNTGDGLYAVADECSHDSAPISGGRLQGWEIVCPRHGARFDIRTGDATAPPAVVGIEGFELKVQGKDIYVLVN